MKTNKEKQENIKESKLMLSESYENEQKFSSLVTSEMRANYRKTQSYIKGWIDYLEGNPAKEIANNEYMIGYKNSKNWENN